MNKLVKKAMSIIMSAMLVASVSAVNMSAAEITAEKSGVVTTGTLSTYIDEATGVKFESDAMTIKNVQVNNDIDMDWRYGFYEERYVIDVFDDAGEFVDYYEVPITVYLPCDKDNCVVLFEGYESSSLLQADAEYVDGSYKLRMEPGWGTYYICKGPFAKGYSTLEQQTLTDETTGVSVSGMIETGSTLNSFDVQDMYDELTEADIDYFPESPYATIGEFDGYGVFLSRNMENAYTEGELTVTLPWPEDGYEVRCISAYAPMSDDDGCEEEVLGFELTATTELTDEELAQRYTTLMDKVHPALDAEYVNGSYVVKGNIAGYYFIAPKGAFTITAEKINKIRSSYEVFSDDDYYEDDGESYEYEELDEELDEEVESPTKVEPATVKKATTAKSDDEKTNVSEDMVVPAVIAVAVVAVVFGAVIVIICKKKSAKK